jgi:hypothetical protein
MFALCQEEISRVWTRGQEGDEKVFVTITRRIGGFGEAYGTDQWKGKAHVGGSLTDPSVDRFGRSHQLKNLALVETRNLIFMREKTQQAARQNLQMVSTGLKRIMRTQNSCMLLSVRGLT